MIILASDHAGFYLKEKVKKYLTQKGLAFIDVGANAFFAEDDYPDYAKKASKLVLENEQNKGIFICGSGIGMSIAANKTKGIRAANVHMPKLAQLAVEHNHINVLTLSGRFLPFLKAKKVIAAFLSASPQNQRHERRVQKLEQS
jgi:ribose 5-phosphate isomerase B